MSKQDGSNRHVTTGTVDDRTATILHVDMDAFFASVELLDHPEHRGKPVIVAHDSARSVVTAATYEARKFGVNSAMPLSLAKRRCPHAIVLPPHFERYQHYSRIVVDLCEQITPRVERLGIDEAFLDVAGASKAVGSPLLVANLLRERVFSETGLRCSVGAASTKFVAKLASSRAKPDGVLVIPSADTVAFLHPLPIAALWGVGAATEAILRGRNIHTIADVAAASREQLESIVGVAGALKLHNLSWGIDPRVVETPQEEKSMGHEVTFETDVTDSEQIRREILRLSGMVAVRLRRAGLQARTVALKLRFGDFTTISRSHTLRDPTDIGRVIYDESRALYAAVGRDTARIRLVGVRVEQLLPVGSAAPLLWDESDNWKEAEDIMDAVSEKFGRGIVGPASLIRQTSAMRLKPSQPEAGTL
ncbi:MAG: DNA polymerase IV [Microbacteriaceae bacterium]